MLPKGLANIEFDKSRGTHKINSVFFFPNYWICEHLEHLEGWA